MPRESNVAVRAVSSTLQRALKAIDGAVICGAILFALVGAPLLMLVVEAVRSASFAALVSAEMWTLFGGSLGLALAIALLSSLGGATLGVLFGACDLIGRRTLLLLHVFPLCLPPFFSALGAFELGASAVFSTAGVVIVLSLALAPLITLVTVLALEGTEATLIDAALLHARPWPVMRRILLPIATPAIGVGAVIAFSLAFQEVGVPMFARVRTYSAAIFTRLGGTAASPGEAFVLALPMLAAAALLLGAERWLSRRPLTVRGLRKDRAPIALRGGRVFWSAIVVAIVGAQLAPIAALLFRSLDVSWKSLVEWSGRSIEISAATSIAGASAIVALTILPAHAIARGGSPWIDRLLFTAFVTPAAALAAGLISFWNRPVFSVVYDSIAIIVAGHVVRYAVFGLRPLAIALAQAPRGVEEAAALAGASFFRRFIRIVVPIHARSIGAAWLLCFIFCLRDYEAAAAYYPAGLEPLTVRIFTLEANGPREVVAALCAVQIAITALAVLLYVSLLRRSRR